MGPSMMGSVEVTEHSEETYAVVVDDLRGDGDLSGEVARFEEGDFRRTLGKSFLSSTASFVH